jgi:hypothetical protein
MGLTQIHGAVANACLIFSLIIAGYGLLRYLRRDEPAVNASFWGALAAGELLYLAQAVIGILLLTFGLRPARTAVHLLYGTVVALTIPAAYAFTRGRDTRREAGLYTVLGLFLAGVSLRAMGTAVQALAAP